MDRSRFVEVPRMDCLVVSTEVVFTLVVCKVFFPRVVFYVKFHLFNSICNPKEAHFHQTRSLSLDCVIHDAKGGRIVAMYWCWRLGMAHFFQCESKYCRLFAIEEKSTKFGFRSGSDNEA